MKLLLDRQIKGFSDKSKVEKKRIRKLANQAVHIQTLNIISILIFCIFIMPNIDNLVTKLFGTESFWRGLIIIIPIAWIYGSLIKWLVVNPKIEQIINENKTEPAVGAYGENAG